MIKKYLRFPSNVAYLLLKRMPLIAAITCDIDISKLDRSVLLNHPYGIVIGAPERIGKNCIIRQNVTIGARHRHNPQYPTLHEGVEVNAGAVVMGNITIGKNARIGANAVILADVPEGVTAVGIWK